MAEKPISGFGKRLKFFREQAGFTQSALAEAVDISVHHITQIERGLSFPSLPVFKNICVVLQVPADFFLAEEDELFARYAAVRISECLSKQDVEKLNQFVELSCHIRSTLHPNEPIL